MANRAQLEALAKEADIPFTQNWKDATLVKKLKEAGVEIPADDGPTPEKKEEEPKNEERMFVYPIRRGFYGKIREAGGDPFWIKGEHEFSDHWMMKAEDAEKEE